jgi:hypothetical protein
LTETKPAAAAQAAMSLMSVTTSASTSDEPSVAAAGIVTI